ncbi:MAG: nuclear transport factor 2 family protein [Allomuricauda sp.]
MFSILFLQACSQNSYNEDLQKLRALNAKFIHNFVTNDTVMHSKIIHPDFVYLNSEGKYINRNDYLTHWAHGFDGYKYWDYRDEKISIFRNIGLVHSQNKYIYVQDGIEYSGMAIYTDIYIKENGEWKCIQAQIGNVSPENYAPDESIIKKYE